MCLKYVDFSVSPLDMHLPVSSSFCFMKHNAIWKKFGWILSGKLCWKCYRGQSAKSISHFKWSFTLSGCAHADRTKALEEEFWAAIFIILLLALEEEFKIWAAIFIFLLLHLQQQKLWFITIVSHRRYHKWQKESIITNHHEEEPGNIPSVVLIWVLSVNKKAKFTRGYSPTANLSHWGDLIGFYIWLEWLILLE